MIESVLRKTGRHLIVDGFADPEVLRNRERLERALEDVTLSVGMTVLDVHAYEVEEDMSKVDSSPFQDCGGITAYVVLSTSHCSFHGWPLTGEFRFDLYSCKDFDARKVEALLCELIRGVAKESKSWTR